MTNSRLGAVLVVLGGVLLGTTPATAQTSQACASAKLKAIGKTASSQFNCHAKAAGLGIPVDPACLQKSEDKWNFPLKGAHQKAEIKGGCALEGQNITLSGRCATVTSIVCDSNLDCAPTGTNGTCTVRNDDTEAQALYDLVVDENLTIFQDVPIGVIDQVIPDLVPNPATPNKCQSGKVKATGKVAAALLNCHSKAAKSNVPVDPTCISKATTKFTSTFAKLELKPPCDTVGDAAGVLIEIQPFVDLAVRAIPRNDGCGSNVVLLPETCDDGNTVNADACPSDCIIDACTANTGTDDAHTVSFTSTKTVGAITVFVDYSEADVGIPGSGAAIPGGIIDGILGDPFTVSSFNDQDHGLTGVLADTNNPPNLGLSGDLFTVHFETCSGGGTPTFTCTVLQAADVLGKPLKGVTCSVN